MSLKKTIDINSHLILRENLFKDYPIFKEVDELPKSAIESLTFKNVTPVNGNIKIADFDYYFSNIIAASSKTMDECKKAKQILQKTGTDN
jgi:NADH-quinone oxidoreductase subunit G